MGHQGAPFRGGDLKAEIPGMGSIQDDTLASEETVWCLPGIVKGRVARAWCARRKWGNRQGNDQTSVGVSLDFTDKLVRSEPDVCPQHQPWACLSFLSISNSKHL